MMAEKSNDASKGHINGGFIQENGDEKVCVIILIIIYLNWY